MYSVYLDRAETSIEALQDRFAADGEVNNSIAALNEIGGFGETMEINMKSLRDFCVEARRKAGERLQSLLIKPVQRIPRYRMLLEVILKSTPTEDTKAHAAISEALKRICETASHVNESVRRKQEALDMGELYKRFQGTIPPIVWHRHQRSVLREGRVDECGRSSL